MSFEKIHPGTMEVRLNHNQKIIYSSNFSEYIIKIQHFSDRTRPVQVFQMPWAYNENRTTCNIPADLAVYFRLCKVWYNNRKGKYFPQTIIFSNNFSGP